MPIYEYSNNTTGDIVQLYQKIGEAVAPTGYSRVFSVSIPVVVGDHAKEQRHYDNEMKIYADYENRHGLGSVYKDIKFKKDELQNISRTVAKNSVKKEKENG